MNKLWISSKLHQHQHTLGDLTKQITKIIRTINKSHMGIKIDLYESFELVGTWLERLEWRKIVLKKWQCWCMYSMCKVTSIAFQGFVALIGKTRRRWTFQGFFFLLVLEMSVTFITDERSKVRNLLCDARFFRQFNSLNFLLLPCAIFLGFFFKCLFFQCLSCVPLLFMSPSLFILSRIFCKTWKTKLENDVIHFLLFPFYYGFPIN
jgi:hypothetical protein